MQRYGSELLAALDAVLADRPDLRVRLLTPPLPAGRVPSLRHILHCPVGRLQGHAWEQFELPRHVGKAIVFCPGNTAPVASLLGRSPVVVTVHDLSYLYFPDAYSRAFRLAYNRLIPLVLKRARRVITVSQSERASILAHYPFAAPRLVAVQNGGLPVGIAEQTPTETDTPTILYVGSLSKRKNFAGMLGVAIDVVRRRDVRFAFAGGVPQGLNATLAEVPADVRDRILFHGQVNDWPRLLDAYRSAAIFFFPSFYEASPLPPIEAMGCGCPVIASAIPSLEERCGAAARYCDPHDSASMTSAIEALLDNPEKRAALREAGYAQARRYSWTTCAQATLEAILQ